MSVTTNMTTSSRFDSETADFAIRSQDGVLFKVHSKNLEVHCEGLLPLRKQGIEDSFVQVTESSSTLELLLQFMYHQRQPSLRLLDFDTVLRLSEAAEKYKLYSAMEICSLKMQEYHAIHPIQVFNYGANYGYHEVAHSAALRTLDTFPGHAATSLIEATLKPWATYHGKWMAALEQNFSPAFSSRCINSETCPCYVAVLADLISSILTQPSLVKQLSFLQARLKLKYRCNGCHQRLDLLFIDVSLRSIRAEPVPVFNTYELSSKAIAPNAGQLCTRFSAADADISFQSCDGLIFRAHRRNLELLSEVFSNGHEFVSDTADIIPLTESSETLELLFQFMYRQRQPDLRKVDFSVLADVAEAAEKYQVFPAMEICRIHMGNALKAHPAAVLNYAVKHGYTEFVDEAAEVALSFPLEELVPDMSDHVLRLWLQYYQSWLDILIYLHRDPPSTNASHFSSCQTCNGCVSRVRSGVGMRIIALQTAKEIFAKHTPSLAAPHAIVCHYTITKWEEEILGKIRDAPKFSTLL